MQFCESQILNPCTIRYDTRCYFNVRSKANMSQLNLPHGECQMMSADVVTRLVYVTVPSAQWLCSSYIWLSASSLIFSMCKKIGKSKIEIVGFVTRHTRGSIPICAFKIALD